MQWFHNLFKKDVGSTGYIQPDEPWPRAPEVKQTPEKDISEPVFAIVECMKKYPSRFKIKKSEEMLEHGPINTYNIRDIKSKQTLQLIQNLALHPYARNFVSWESWSWQWLTRDEKDLLKESFENMMKVKKDRLYSIQRAKMKGFYK